MKHLQAGLIVGAVVLFVVFIVTGLNHFIGPTGTSILGLAVIIAVIGGAVIDYLTEKGDQ